MSLQHASAWRRLALTALLATLTIAGFSWPGAEARTAHHHAQALHQIADVVHGPKYHPPYSAIVIDHNSDQVLHSEHVDEPRHPASLTKIMTLYLLFEQLEAGRLKLDTQLRVSAFAAQQPPTKLGLKANQTLAVEDAINGTRQPRGHELEPKDEPVALTAQDALTAPEVEEEQKDPTSREHSYRGAASLPRPNWSRPLPRLLIVSGVMTAATLNDVRVMIERHLPAASRAKEMWRYVSNELREAALGSDTAEFSAVLEMALSIEGLEWAPK
jgi:hypothetical protein